MLVRFPDDTGYLDRNRQPQTVDWVAVDLDLLERYGLVFRGDWRKLRNSRRWIVEHRQDYSIQALEDGVAVLQRKGPNHADLESALDQQLQRPMPLDPRLAQR